MKPSKSYYMSDYQRTHRSEKTPGTRTLIVEIPASLFHQVNKARAWFPDLVGAHNCSLRVAITNILYAVPKNGELPN
jgi:hypothetical protein